jgi:CRP/FNR family cyclic AMP-dependent transcriptional regulator
LLAKSLPEAGFTEILGIHQVGFSLASGENRPMGRLRRRISRLTWAGPTSQKAGGPMAIEKCITDYDVDDVIFEEGSIGRELFVVLEGKVDIVKINAAGKTVIVTLGKGEFFGEMAVIDGSSRSATAIAAAPNTRVMRINHARFVYLVSQQPAFALMIMDALSKRLRASNAVTFRAAGP